MRAVRHGLIGLFILWLSYGVSLWSHEAHSLSADEAWLAWVIHHEQRPPDGIRATVNALIADVQSAWERSRPSLPLYPLALNSCAWVAGESVLALRYLGILGGVLVIALSIPLARRLGRWRWAVPVAMSLLVMLLAHRPTPDWAGTIAQITATRTPQTVALFAHDPQHPLAYYARHTALRTGISLDLGWRAFSPEEISTIISPLQDQATLWVIGQRANITLQTIESLLATTHTPTPVQVVGDSTFTRWERR